MKTIKERADEYIGHSKEMGEDLSISMSRNAYIHGATDQKSIDIKKAGEWLCESCPAQLDEENDFGGCTGYRDSCCPTLESLINAMKE